MLASIRMGRDDDHDSIQWQGAHRHMVIRCKQQCKQNIFRTMAGLGALRDDQKTNLSAMHIIVWTCPRDGLAMA